MSIPLGILLAVVLVLLLVLLVLLTRSRPRSTNDSITHTVIDAGESVTIQAGDPPEDAEEGSRFVLSGNFTGATIFLGADARDLDIATGPPGAEDTDSEDSSPKAPTP